MNNLKQAALDKSRSYISCLSEAHRMLFDNIRQIFSKTWIFVLVLSILSATYFSIHIHAMLYGTNTALTTGICITAVATLCAQVVYLARVMFLINGRPMIWNIKRCTNITACYIGFCFILTLIYAAITYGIVLSKGSVTLAELLPVFYIFGGVSFVIMLIMLPFIYVGLKYIMEPDSKLRKIITKSYVTGLRYWGFIFIALLLATLCTSICGALVSIPTLIVMAANALSVFGVNYLGDPTGLPSYFTVIQFTVVTFSSFICLYINIFAIFVCYFLYGSIETKEKEKKEYEKNKNVKE